jgi:hypothetical protein
MSVIAEIIDTLENKLKTFSKKMKSLEKIIKILKRINKTAPSYKINQMRLKR